MKTPGLLLLLACVWLVSKAEAQGTFIYDQQSSDENLLGEFSANIQSSQPIGQSFTPSLPSVGFIRLRLSNAGIGGLLQVNLRENSITGNVLAASSPVSLPTGFAGFVDFLLPGPATVSPGTVYFFQPVVQSGTGWFVDYHNGFGYAGGTALFQGQPSGVVDLWFREGLYVPEPTATVILLLGVAWLGWVRNRKFPP